MPTATSQPSRVNDPAAAFAAQARAAMRARESDFDEFRRVDYTQGWDADDALLGWVDDDVVRGSRRD